MTYNNSKLVGTHKRAVTGVNYGKPEKNGTHRSQLSGAKKIMKPSEIAT